MLHPKVRLKFSKKVVITLEQRGRNNNNNNKNQGEKKENKKKSHLAHIKPLNPKENPSLVFFTERMITIKRNFLNSGRAFFLASCMCYFRYSCYFRQYLTDILVY